VRPSHQFGGSTLVTTRDLSGGEEFCAAWAGAKVAPRRPARTTDV